MDLLLLIAIIAVGAVVAFVGYRQQTIVASAKQALSEQTKLLEAARQDLTQREQAISSVQAEMAKADDVILQLRQDVSQKDTDLHTLRDQTKDQETKLSDLRRRLRNIEHESTQSKALFTTISNVAYDLVFVLDEESTILTTNKSADTLFGDKSPIGERLADVLNAPDLEGIVARAISEEESLEEQFVVEQKYYRARTKVMYYQGDHFFVGVAIQDITQLVRLNRARRDMVANISHELRTPITKIRFVIDNLFHEQSRPKRKASIASLREISQEIGTLEDVVQELLDLSMIESGQAIMKLVDEPLGEIVASAVARLEEKLEQKNLTVVQHIPAKMAVLCDRDQIRRVISNLISNAIKWSPENDAVTISANNGGEEVIISVFDNGPGVPNDQRERIFERFYQVDTARSGKDGSGLGLAICKHIVEAHGGRIWAEGNAQGGGGRFLFTLYNATQPLDDESYLDRGQHDFDPRAPLPEIVPDPTPQLEEVSVDNDSDEANP